MVTKQLLNWVILQVLTNFVFVKKQKAMENVWRCQEKYKKLKNV